MGTCKVEGCKNRLLTQEYCSTHHGRIKKFGSPHIGGTLNGEAWEWLRSVAMSFEGEECLTWPFSRNHGGYAKISVNEKWKNANRIVCEEQHGPPPTPKHHAAHSCGNGHLGCINRNHLRWATPKENADDRKMHEKMRMGRWA